MLVLIGLAKFDKGPKVRFNVVEVKSKALDILNSLYNSNDLQPDNDGLQLHRFEVLNVWLILTRVVCRDVAKTHTAASQIPKMFGEHDTQKQVRWPKVLMF